MAYIISAVTGAVGGVSAVLLIGLFPRRRRRLRERKQNRRKIEFSKLVLSAVLFTYFGGFIAGLWAIVADPAQLGGFLVYIGTPTTTVIGFYSWKAKAENVVKIKQANPKATEGAPVDLNSIQT